MNYGIRRNITKMFFIFVIGLFSSSIFINSVYAKDAYTFGVVPQFEARKIHQIWKPVLDQLNQRTGYTFSLLGSKNIPEFEKKLIAGEFDFAYMNPYHFILANERQGYVPLVRDVSRQLSGILVVRKDSDISSPKDLNGMELAFPAPNALGASLQMRQELSDIFGITFTPKYVRTHDSVYLNVVLKKVSAGGGVGKTFNKQKAAISDALKVIHSTRPVSPHPVAAHARIPELVLEKVGMAFLDMSETAKGAELLSKIPLKKVGHSVMADYEDLKSMDLGRFYEAPK